VRSSVPLGHKINAVVVAALSACGLYAFLCYRETQLASAASLSFDSGVAQQLDPGITSAPHPAVVLGQSILSDSVVASLIPRADLAASSAAHAIGEFRTRVELTQPAASLLLVRYLDPDPGHAAATANSVAEALAGWAPSTTGDLPPAANAHSASASAAPGRAPGAEPSLAVALGELHAQLSGADRLVGADSSLLSDHERQRYLESQVRVAQRKLNDLRGEFARSGSAAGRQHRLDLIQRALALFWPSADDFDTSGTSEPQLSYEREQLTHVIGVIEQQVRAVQRGGAAAASPPASSAVSGPLHLERLAGPPAPVVWWPSALIGCFCGLFYWGLAFAFYYVSREADDLLYLPEESAASTYRLFDIDERVPAGFHEAPSDAHPVETASPKPAPFAFVPSSISTPVPDRSPSPELVRGSTPDPVLNGPPEPEMVPTLTALAGTASDADPVAFPRAPEEQDKVFHEKIVERVDPWEEEIRKNLSQTAFARMLDPRIALEDAAATKFPARDVGAHESERDRLAG